MSQSEHLELLKVFLLMLIWAGVSKANGETYFPIKFFAYAMFIFASVIRVSEFLP